MTFKKGFPLLLVFLLFVPCIIVKGQPAGEKPGGKKPAGIEPTGEVIEKKNSTDPGADTSTPILTLNHFIEKALRVKT